MRPTIVLVHGAFAESASWHGVIRRLQAAGHPVIAAATSWLQATLGLYQAAEAVASERGCEAESEPVWRIEPIAFDPELVGLARDACELVAGTAFELPSGALHDAASMAPHVPRVAPSAAYRSG